MNQRKKNAVYHFLGATVGLLPLIGIAAPALYFVFRKFPPIEEENHYRGVMNFLITFFITGLAVYGIFPKPVAGVIWLVWTLITMLILVYNGVHALKGGDATYPLSIQFMKPLRKTRSPEERMWSQDDIL